MSQSIGRREFLQGVAATTILGFPFLSGCNRAKTNVVAAEPEPVESDKLLALAKSRMQSEVKPGVILVIPSDEKAASAMETSLAQILSANPELPKVENGKGKEKIEQIAGASESTIREILCQAVFICLPESFVRSKFPDVTPGVGAVLLDPDGNAAASLPHDRDMYSKPAFVAGMTKLIQGEDGKRLADYAKRQLDALRAVDRENLEHDLKALDSKRYPERQSASRNLGRFASRITAVLAAALNDRPSAEKRQRIQILFQELYSSVSADEPGPRLPFGVAWRTDNDPKVCADPCPPCGMVAVAHRSRQFIRFIAKESK